MWSNINWFFANPNCSTIQLVIAIRAKINNKIEKEKKIVNEIIKNINDTVDEKKDIAPEIEWDDDSI